MPPFLYEKSKIIQLQTDILVTSEIKSNMINYVHKLLTYPKYPVSVFTKSTSVYTMLYIYIVKLLDSVSAINKK